MAKVCDFMPWRALYALKRALQQIRKANGYNCNPLVTLDILALETSRNREIIFIDAESLDPIEYGMAGAAHPRMDVELRVFIYGVVDYEADDPRRASMALQQDVHNAIAAFMSTWRSSVATGATVNYDGVTYDVGALAPDKRSSFSLTVAFRFKVGPTW